jgi:hypothetical protein
MPEGRSPSFISFNCPNCNALYQVVQAEAGPETVYSEIHAAVAARRFQGAKANSSSSIFFCGRQAVFRSGSGPEQISGSTECEVDRATVPLLSPSHQS